ncbi:transposase [Clostridium sp. AWRP]|uniref:transposase n=1 Tax=Clostridium sp. AWRP TaxID=2212991 RepID=UPI000FD9D7EF|nr:transposase [Clostridium sp. AWRP]AZV57863.1 transposase [Clostridium sp. AWRP]
MVETGSGNINEAETFIKLNKKLKEYSAFETKYHIMDSGYDYEYVYKEVRKEGAVPIIDYNFRNEKLTKEALKRRGYDELGRPYAPCGKVCSPNGHDSKRKSVKYICGKKEKECENCEHYNKNMDIQKTCL